MQYALFIFTLHNNWCPESMESIYKLHLYAVLSLLSCTFVQCFILSFQLGVEMTKRRKIRLREPAFISHQDRKGSSICCEGLLASFGIKKKLIFITWDLGMILNSPEVKGWMIRQVSNVESLMAGNCWRENVAPHLYTNCLRKWRHLVSSCREVIRRWVLT